jgi:arylformamidase
MVNRSEYYTVAHPDQFDIDWTSFYNKAGELTDETRKKLRNKLNINYGTTNNPKQTLDIYFPSEQANNTPVFIFLHGGGFQEGDKDDYGYVALPFASRGVITVVATYRWAREYRYPSQVEDTRDILSWVYRNIGSMGGDPEKIYIGGHSAGAILSASVSVDPSWTARRQLPVDLVKGCIPISATYDMRTNPYAEPYVSDSRLIIEASPILNITHPAQENLVAVGTKEEIYVQPSKDLVAKLSEKGVNAKLLILENMDHAETVWSLRDANGKLFQEIMKIVK